MTKAAGEELASRKDFEQQMLLALKEQTRLLTEHSHFLHDMGRSIKALEKQAAADHSEFPLPDRGWNDERGWAAIFKTAMSRTRSQTDMWKGGLDVNLIFIALFVTVITAFQAPVLESLSPDPGDLTNELLKNLTEIWIQTARLNGLNAPTNFTEPSPFEPSTASLAVYFLWFLSLIICIVMAVLAVFGRQWVTALATSSHAKSSVDLVMTHKTREELATKLLSPILDLLQPALVLSIGLFVAGLLFQAWNMAFQINPNSVVLMVSASSGTFLIVILGLVIGATLLHGIVNDNSPFRSPLTELVRRWRDQCDEDDTSHVPAHQTLLEESFSEHFLVSVQQTSEPAHIDALTPLIKSHFSFIPPKRFWPLVCGTMQHILRSGASTPAKLTIANHIPTLYSSRVLSDSPATEEDRRLAQFQVTSSWNFHEIIVELYMQAAEDGVEHRQYYLTGYVVSLCVGLEPILPRVLKTRSSVVDPSVCVRKLLHLAYWLRLDTKSNVSIDLVLLTEKLWSEILAVVKMECTRQCEDVERSRFVEIFEAVRPETFFDAWLIDNISIPGAEWSRQALEVITRRHSLLTLSILSKCLSNRRYETLEEDVLKLIMAVLHILRTTVDVESESRSAGDLDLSGLFEYLNDRPNRSHVSPFESVNSFDFAIVAVTNFLWELCTLSCLDKRAFSPLIDFLVRNCELYGGKNGRLSQRVVRLSVVVLVRMQGQVIPFEDRGRRLSLPPIRTVRGTWSPLSSSPHGSSRNSPTTTLGSTIRNSKLITRIVNLASLGQSNDPEQQEPSPADVMISHLHALVCELPNNTPLGTFMQMAIMNMRPPQPRYGRGRRPGVSYLDEGRFQDRLIMCRQPSRRAFDLDTKARPLSDIIMRKLK